MFSVYCHSHLWCIPIAGYCADWDTARIALSGPHCPKNSPRSGL